MKQGGSISAVTSPEAAPRGPPDRARQSKPKISWRHLAGGRTGTSGGSTNLRWYRAGGRTRGHLRVQELQTASRGRTDGVRPVAQKRGAAPRERPQWDRWRAQGSHNPVSRTLPLSLPVTVALPVRDAQPDIGLAKALLDWEPTVDLETGIKTTIDCFWRLLPQLAA